MEKTISMSEFLRDPAKVTNQVITSPALYRLRKRGHRDVILVNEDYLDGWIAMIELAAHHPNWREMLEQGRRELAAGGGFSLEEVARELGLERTYNSARRRTTREAAKTSRAKGASSTRGTGGRPARRSRSR